MSAPSTYISRSQIYRKLWYDNIVNILLMRWYNNFFIPQSSFNFVLIQYQCWDERIKLIMKKCVIRRLHGYRSTRSLGICFWKWSMFIQYLNKIKEKNVPIFYWFTNHAYCPLQFFHADATYHWVFGVNIYGCYDYNSSSWSFLV